MSFSTSGSSIQVVAPTSSACIFKFCLGNLNSFDMQQQLVAGAKILHSTIHSIFAIIHSLKGHLSTLPAELKLVQSKVTPLKLSQGVSSSSIQHGGHHYGHKLDWNLHGALLDAEAQRLQGLKASLGEVFLRLDENYLYFAIIRRCFYDVKQAFRDYVWLPFDTAQNHTVAFCFVLTSQVETLLKTLCQSTLLTISYINCALSPSAA